MPNPRFQPTPLASAWLPSVAAAFFAASTDATVTNEGTACRLDDATAAYTEAHLLCESSGCLASAAEREAARRFPLTGSGGA